jgi:hypothetical protein
MRKLYFNNELLAVIYDNDTQVGTEINEESDNLDTYLMQVIETNLQKDGIEWHGELRWEGNNE